MSDSPDNPILVEVTRGPMVESQHRGSACVYDTEGQVVAEWGDVDTPIYPRSSVKLIQALPYLLTVVLLAGFIGRTVAPQALGRPYLKER